MTTLPKLFLGAARPLRGTGTSTRLDLPAHHLVTHGVVVGMTGSGKTGLIMVMIEEAARSGVPTLVIDVKGDLPDLLLAFPDFAPSSFRPWVDGYARPGDSRSADDIAVALAEERRKRLASWDLDEPTLAGFRTRTDIRVLTPGSTAGEPLHILSSLERRSPLWDIDADSARAALSAAVSLVLRLVGEEPDPSKSRANVLLSVLAERRLVARAPADLASLIEDLAHPPIEMLGALTVDAFMPKHARRELSAALNTLLASPTFTSWRRGASLDVGAFMTPREGRTPVTIVSVAHLDDEERALVLGVVLEETLAWTRSLQGSQSLRGLVVFDEVYGFLPPHPRNPPTKRPLVALMKQARAFGVGVVVATQNPMDLDYRALGNAGLWCVGRLQTDADRARVIDGLASSIGAAGKESVAELSSIVKNLSPRWFVMRDAHEDGPPVLLQPRWAMSFLKGPLTRVELARATGRASAEPSVAPQAGEGVS